MPTNPVIETLFFRLTKIFLIALFLFLKIESFTNREINVGVFPLLIVQNHLEQFVKKRLSHEQTFLAEVQFGGVGIVDIVSVLGVEKVAALFDRCFKLVPDFISDTVQKCLQSIRGLGLTANKILQLNHVLSCIRDWRYVAVFF